MKASTQQLYARRLTGVIDYLNQHLDLDPDLYRLADIACLSPFHFHRVWRAWTGETIADTVRRLRLHRASGELAATTAALGQIAQRAGYDSPAAFSRAFRQAFGLPPSSFRAAQAAGFPPADHSPTVRIETVAPMALTAVMHNGPFMEIGQAFDRLFLWARQHDADPYQQRVFGLFYCEEGGTSASPHTAAAAMGSPTGYVADGETQALYVPAMRCAALEYVGPYAGISGVCTWLYEHWLPTNDELPGDFPEFEEYLNDPRTTPPAELRTLIRVPLAD